MPSNQLRYSSVRKSQSPTCSTRWALTSRCRIQGSSVDNHARISVLSSALPKFTLDTWPNEIVLFVTVLNERVILKESLLKELLLRELLLSSTRDCDISLVLLLFAGVDLVYCGGFGEWVFEYRRVGSIDGAIEAEEKRGWCFPPHWRTLCPISSSKISYTCTRG